MNKLHNLVESSENIRFILAASPHFIQIVSGQGLSCSAFLSAFETHILPVITPDDAIDLIRQFVNTITDNNIERILSFTYYQPYLIRIFIAKLLQDGNLRNPTKEFAIDAYNANALEGIFPNYFEGLNKSDQQLIHQIHNEKFEFSDKYETRLRALEQYGYLKSVAGNYQISNWFFQHWLVCKSGAAIPCGSQLDPVPNPKEIKNIKLASQNKDETISFTSFQDTTTRSKLIYSLSGLLLSLFCIIGGVFLFCNGVTGGSNLTAKFIGLESTISDAAPGALLFVIGLFVVFVTRFGINKQTLRPRDREDQR
ncbi:hypothetical protein DESC_80004 [Desulfosarcina cetonica]|uniref:hypothetical protein n=1 Tax=Desulfosarcina cetonica TaxID=90730 RepID=UPI0006D2BCC2|nr:hypothetical protein [Desulfosarcina cetonica]VTR70379.1 hypothetical protein DESC_80004 [Desulfosarcina cetonica]